MHRLEDVWFTYFGCFVLWVDFARWGWFRGLAVVVTAASASDNAIGRALLDIATDTHPTLTKTWVDAGFKTTLVEYGATLGIDVETVTKDPSSKGFSIIKRRWVVERTLGWLMQHRRLARDYETLPDHSASMITLAMIDNLAKRLTNETTHTWRNPPKEQTHKIRKSNVL